MQPWNRMFLKKGIDIEEAELKAFYLVSTEFLSFTTILN